ncbi:hypothetical protein BKA82DRAFT_152771 [Pisolithus tinctorius]|uniref:Uncharacterized protein n=1 Tax=Pisolithus tinctorius Marx 270 TaxID=870435 RepID=A0A0C3NZC3_PISTI|nr:hypothetical protein BKA82DRAFT_152771 [Pisolithus tinctorius]KIO00454.1 hypothetical protein M404DRAFT_152771 [Pisolithus tinctorius Marx 270]
MNITMGQIHSDDATCLRAYIGQYVAPHPLEAGVSPPIMSAGSKSGMGINHPVLAHMLCPTSARDKFIKNPSRTCQQLIKGNIQMTAEEFLLFLWEGDPPVVQWDEENQSDGLFKGYVLERVMCHIFTGPSTALGEQSHGTQTCNTILHGMTSVEPEHIAYASVQAHYAMSSKNKWGKVDGDFNYCKFYYGIIKMICKCPNEDWVVDLMKWWNMKILRNESGCDSGAGAISDFNTEEVASSTSSLQKMQAQMAACVAAKQRVNARPPTPLHSSPPLSRTGQDKHASARPSPSSHHSWRAEDKNASAGPSFSSLSSEHTMPSPAKAKKVSKKHLHIHVLSFNHNSDPEEESMPTLHCSPHKNVPNTNVKEAAITPKCPTHKHMSTSTASKSGKSKAKSCC